MSISGAFNLTCSLPPVLDRRGGMTRPSPFSIRLSESERARMAVEAAGAPLGAYIKAKVLGDVPPLRVRRTGLAVADKQALGQALALLGRSRLASNLNQLAFAANIGSLALTTQTEALLVEALNDVCAIRRLLLSALGMKAEAVP